MAVAAVLLAGCGGGAGPAAPPVPKLSVGVHGTVTDQLLPGGELEVKPLDDPLLPVVVRITATYPHGDSYRYDLEYYGLEPGSYNLCDYLQRVDGTPAPNLPAIPVEIVEILPPGQVLPAALEPGALPGLGGYTVLLWTGGVLWVLGLAAILFWRKRHVQAAAAQRPETFADRLRPLVESAMRGDGTTTEQAELERMLLGYWRAKLGLGELEPGVALAKLRDHAEAGALLRQLEVWLHAPPGRGRKVNLQNLLAPYWDMAADAYEQMVASGAEG